MDQSPSNDFEFSFDSPLVTQVTPTPKDFLNGTIELQFYVTVTGAYQFSYRCAGEDTASEEFPFTVNPSTRFVSSIFFPSSNGFLPQVLQPLLTP